MRTISMNYEEYLEDLQKAAREVEERCTIEYNTHFISAMQSAKTEAVEEVINLLVNCVKTGNINHVFKINHTNTDNLKVIAAAMLGAYSRTTPAVISVPDATEVEVSNA